MAKKLPPLHPGEVLRAEFLVPMGLSPGALAKACGVPRTGIERLANEQIGVTADTALRLSKAFGTTPELWLNLQNSFDVRTARPKDRGRAGPDRACERQGPVIWFTSRPVHLIHSGSAIARSSTAFRCER